MVIPTPPLWSEAEPYSILEFRLDEARDDEEINYPGDNITATTNGTLAGISIKFQSKRNQATPLDSFNPITYPSGFAKFYLTNTQQAGKKLRLFIGRAVGAAAPTFVATQIVKISGETVKVSGEAAVMYGYDYQSGEYRAVYVDASGEIKIAVTVADIVTAKISGEAIVIGQYMPEAPTLGSGDVSIVRADITGRLIAAVSGETVSVASGAYVLVSGQMIAVASGAFVLISGQQVIAKVSGEVAKISGEIITAKVSGETVSIETPTAIKTGAILTPTAESAGTIVTSGAVKAATFKSLSGDVYLGGTAEGDMPYSGYGFLLAAGEAASLDIDNFGRARVCAPVHSGDWVSYIGVN